MLVNSITGTDSDAEANEDNTDSEGEDGNSAKKRLGYGKKEKELLMSFAEAYQRARGDSKAISVLYHSIGTLDERAESYLFYRRLYRQRYTLGARRESQ
jgi:hypothetical protein